MQLRWTYVGYQSEHYIETVSSFKYLLADVLYSNIVHHFTIVKHVLIINLETIAHGYLIVENVFTVVCLWTSQGCFVYRMSRESVEFCPFRST